MKIKKRDIITFLKMTVFMLPVGLLTSRIFSAIWYGLIFLVISFFVVDYSRSHKYLFKLKAKWFLLIYMLVQCFCTAYNDGPWLKNLLSLLVTFSMCCLFENYLEKNVLSCISVFKSLLLIYMMIEILLYLLFDLSLLSTIQCGYVYYVVWATLSIYLSKIHGQKNNEVIIVSIIFVLATVIKPDNGENYEWTFYVIALLFCAFALFDQLFYKFRKVLCGNIVFLIIISLNLIFVIFSIQENLPILRFIIVDIMHKRIDLTGRSGIWDFAKRIILLRPITGYGTGFTTLTTQGYWYDFIRKYGPHNQFLYVLMAGGIITLPFYIFLLLHVFGILNKNKQEKTSVIFCFGLLAMYLELMMTYRTYANCMPLFVLFEVIDFLFYNDNNRMQKFRLSTLEIKRGGSIK